MKSISALLRAGLFGTSALSATGTAQAIEVLYAVLITIGDLGFRNAGPMTITYDEDDVPTTGSDAIS